MDEFIEKNYFLNSINKNKKITDKIQRILKKCLYCFFKKSTHKKLPKFEIFLPKSLSEIENDKENNILQFNYEYYLLQFLEIALFLQDENLLIYYLQLFDKPKYYKNEQIYFKIYLMIIQKKISQAFVNFETKIKKDISNKKYLLLAILIYEEKNKIKKLNKFEKREYLHFLSHSKKILDSFKIDFFFALYFMREKDYEKFLEFYLKAMEKAYQECPLDPWCLNYC